jgi:hypothetical protein
LVFVCFPVVSNGQQRSAIENMQKSNCPQLKNDKNLPGSWAPENFPLQNTKLSKHIRLYEQIVSQPSCNQEFSITKTSPVLDQIVRVEIFDNQLVFSLNQN